MKLPVLLIALCLLGGCMQQAAQEPPPPPPKPPLEFIGEWGTPGDGPGQLKSPLGMAVDRIGNVYVVDGASRFVHKFDPRGTPLLSFQDPTLRLPSGVTVDQGGAIYVSDFSSGCVVIFLPDGARLRRICGSGAARLSDVMALAVAEDGAIFVLDRHGNRIVKFNSRGRFLRAWGDRGDAPNHLENAFDLAVGPDGSLYVTDTDNHRVQKFSQDGELVASWVVPLPANDPDTVRFLSAIAVGRDHVFLANSLKRSIEVWSADGHHELSVDLSPWLKPGPPEIPGVALLPRGELLVLDPVAARVLRFRINF